MRRVAAAALLMAAGVIPAAAAREEPFDLTAAPDVAARGYVRASGLSALQGIRRVAIPGFQVEFVVETQAHELVPSRANEMARLTGVDRAAFGRIAESFHAAFVSGLKGLGIEALPYDAIRDAGAWDDYRPALRSAPTTLTAPDHTSLFHASGDMRLYFPTGDRRSGRFPRVPPRLETQLAKEAGVPVVRLRMVVDITRHTGNGKGKAAITLKEGATSLTLITPAGRTASLALAKNVNAAAATFEVERVDPAFWDGAASPFYSSSQAPAHAIRATTPAYEKAVDDHLAAVLAMFLSELKAGL